MQKKNSYLLILVTFVLLLSNGCKKEGVPETITDVDGNVYHTLKIGTQVWLLENLKVSKYRNGDIIPNVTDNSAWSMLSTGALCDIDELPANSLTYGKLYNWYAVTDNRKIAPDGWHIPSEAEWATLIAFLGGESVAGGKLRETGTEHWLSPNSTATNSSGFTGLGTGYCKVNGDFDELNFNTYFWTTTEFDINTSISYGFDGFSTESFHSDYSKQNGFPVRCIMD